jgi:hypothetical protein
MVSLATLRIAGANPKPRAATATAAIARCVPAQTLRPSQAAHEPIASLAQSATARMSTSRSIAKLGDSRAQVVDLVAYALAQRAFATKSITISSSLLAAALRGTGRWPAGNPVSSHCAQTPPSTGNVCPVTYWASSESNQTTGSAISSGWPILPIGTNEA